MMNMYAAQPVKTTGEKMISPPQLLRRASFGAKDQGAPFSSKTHKSVGWEGRKSDSACRPDTSAYDSEPKRSLPAVFRKNEQQSTMGTGETEWKDANTPMGLSTNCHLAWQCPRGFDRHVGCDLKTASSRALQAEQDSAPANKLSFRSHIHRLDL